MTNNYKPVNNISQASFLIISGKLKLRFLGGTNQPSFEQI